MDDRRPGRAKTIDTSVSAKKVIHPKTVLDAKLGLKPENEELVINQLLIEELLQKILETSDYETIAVAANLCKRWEGTSFNERIMMDDFKVNIDRDLIPVMKFLRARCVNRIILGFFGGLPREDGCNPESFIQFMKGMSGILKSLTLEDSLKLSNKAVRHAFKSCILPELMYLKIHEGLYFNETMLEISRSCPKLQTFISGGSRLSNEALKDLGLNMPNIRVLNLGICPYIEDKGVKYIAEYFPNLRELTLNFAGISMSGVKIIAGIKSLDYLALERCNRIDHHCVNILAKGLSNLETLRIHLVKCPPDVLCERIGKSRFDLIHLFFQFIDLMII